MFSFVIRPLRTEGKLLLPVGPGTVVHTDHLHQRRAIVAVCDKRGWMIHRRSSDLRTCVVGEQMPCEVVFSVGGKMLLGVWKAEVVAL